MADILYKLVFSGQIQAGQQPDEVKGRLAALYNSDVAAIERKLFGGKTVTVKTRLHKEAARKLQGSLTKRTGALFEIVRLEQQTAPDTNPPGAADLNAADGSLESDAVNVNTPPEHAGEARLLEKRIGFWPRLAASLVDLDLILMVGFPFGMLFGAALGALFINTPADDSGFGLTGALSGLAGSMGGVLIVTILYNLIEPFTGASPGKMMIGLKIARDNGAKAGLGILFLRYAAKNTMEVGALLTMITTMKAFEHVGGILWLIWFFGCLPALGGRKQALHDRLLKTAVFRKRALTDWSPSSLDRASSHVGGGVLNGVQWLLAWFRHLFLISPSELKTGEVDAAPPKHILFRRLKTLEFLVGLAMGIGITLFVFYAVVVPFLFRHFSAP